MARIKIKDLPKDMKISKDDMRKVTGGGAYIANTNPTIDENLRTLSAFTESTITLDMIADSIAAQTKTETTTKTKVPYTTK